MKLVLHKFRSLYTVAINCGIEHNDIEQTAWLNGIMRAALKYDPTHVNPRTPGKPIIFATYAAWWVYQAVQRLIESKTKKDLRTSSGRLQSENIVGSTGDASSLFALIGRQPDRNEVEDRERQHVLMARVADVLSRCLDERRRQVVSLYWGLHDGKQRTHDEIADILGVSRQRVHQMYREAMARIRLPITSTCADLRPD